MSCSSRRGGCHGAVSRAFGGRCLAAPAEGGGDGAQGFARTGHGWPRVQYDLRGWQLWQTQSVALQRVDRVAAEPGTFAAVTVLDSLEWRLIRLTVSAEAPDPSRPGTAYQVFYLAKPGLEALG